MAPFELASGPIPWIKCPELELRLRELLRGLSTEDVRLALDRQGGGARGQAIWNGIAADLIVPLAGRQAQARRVDAIRTRGRK